MNIFSQINWSFDSAIAEVLAVVLFDGVILVIEKTEEIMRTAAATDISADVDDIEEIVQEKIDQVAATAVDGLHSAHRLQCCRSAAAIGVVAGP